jgi:hypothetical protein
VLSLATLRRKTFRITTLCKLAISLTTLIIITLSKVTLSIKIFSITTHSIMTFSKMALVVKHNKPHIMLGIFTFIIVPLCITASYNDITYGIIWYFLILTKFKHK